MGVDEGEVGQTVKTYFLQDATLKERVFATVLFNFHKSTERLGSVLSHSIGEKNHSSER